MGTIEVTCGVCGSAIRQYPDESTDGTKISHGVCTREACLNEFRRRVGLPPITNDPHTKATLAYMSAVADELSAALEDLDAALSALAEDTPNEAAR